MISSILSRENLTQINILWIPSNNIYFEKFIHNISRFKIFYIDHIYLGSLIPDIVISNNITTNIDIVIDLCQHHHSNLIIIDHETKSDLIDYSKTENKLAVLPNIYRLATSQQIKNSWGNNLHDNIFDYKTSGSDDMFIDIILENINKKFIYE